MLSVVRVRETGLDSAFRCTYATVYRYDDRSWCRMEMYFAHAFGVQRNAFDHRAQIVKVDNKPPRDPLGGALTNPADRDYIKFLCFVGELIAQKRGKERAKLKAAGLKGKPLPSKKQPC